jgi:hypothetical protein
MRRRLANRLSRRCLDRLVRHWGAADNQNKHDHDKQRNRSQGTIHDILRRRWWSRLQW